MTLATEVVCCLVAHTTRSTIIQGTTTFNNNKMKLFNDRHSYKEREREKESADCVCMCVCVCVGGGEMLNVIKFNA